jgi:hypothetical protein
MSDPEPNRILDPPFSVGADAEAESVARSGVPAVFHFDTGTFQPFDPSLNGCHVRDGIICADDDEGPAWGSRSPFAST